MKKSFLFIAMATVAVAGCLKSETVVIETPQELTFGAMSNVATKANEVTTAYLPGDYRIYASATQKASNGQVYKSNYFTDQAFDTDAVDAALETAVYHAWDAETNQAAPIYWPLGGYSLDYIAYALPLSVHDADPALAEGPEATWVNEANMSLGVASHMAFNGWDTYKNQVDLLWAYKNDATTATSAEKVELEFAHAQALLEFNAKVNIPNVLQIQKITINGLLVKGDFIVDNTKNTIKVYWSGLSPVVAEDVVAPGVEPTDDNLHTYNNAEDPTAAASEYLDNDQFELVGSTLLIPEQKACNIVVTYVISGNEMTYEYNNTRTMWEMGKKYIYNLDFVLNEVAIAPTVKVFEDVVEPVPSLE